MTRPPRLITPATIKQVVARYLTAAYRASRKNVRPYRSKFSKRRFSRPQIMACLLLGRWLDLDSNGLRDLISGDPALIALLELRYVPDSSTFRRHRSRTPEKVLEDLTDRAARMIGDERLANPE